MPLPTIGANIRSKTGSAPSKGKVKLDPPQVKRGGFFFCPAAFFRLTTKKFPVKMPCGRRNFCSRFVPCRAWAKIIFREAIFSIDKAAGSCYNGCDSAKNGLAPILADLFAFVKRKNKKFCTAGQTDKRYYVKRKNAFKSTT